MYVLQVAEHSFLRALVLMRGGARTKIAKKKNKQTWHRQSENLFVLYLFCVCFFLLTITHDVVGFSRLLEWYIRRVLADG